jgi:hypothetical protein
MAKLIWGLTPKIINMAALYRHHTAPPILARLG